MQTILFLCTGNYYRSRYAEIVFNWHAARQGLAWRADSRGLDPNPGNTGPMSRNTIAALQQLGIPHEPHLRMPRVASDDDFAAADHVVAVKQDEHLPLLERLFPQWVERVEFWHVHDVDCCGPEETLPHLDREIAALLARLKAAKSEPA